MLLLVELVSTTLYTVGQFNLDNSCYEMIIRNIFATGNYCHHIQVEIPKTGGEISTLLSTYEIYVEKV